MNNIKDQKVLVTVRSIINDPRNRILILKRRSKENYNPLKWELPGGVLDQQESIIDGVQRKVYEETNLVINVNPNNYYCHSRFVQENSKYKGFQYIEITSVSDYLSGKVIITDRHTDYTWVNFEDIFEYDLSIESRKAITNYVNDIDRLNKLDEPNKRPLIIAVRALIKDHRDKYLMIQRSTNNAYSLKWELPGGKLNTLEMLENSLIREVLEETNVLIDILHPVIYIGSHIENTGRYKGYTYINLVSSTTIKGGTIKLSEKHSDFGWFKKEEIFNLDLAQYIKIQLAEILFKKNNIDNYVKSE